MFTKLTKSFDSFLRQMMETLQDMMETDQPVSVVSKDGVYTMTAYHNLDTLCVAFSSVDFETLRRTGSIDLTCALQPSALGKPIAAGFIARKDETAHDGWMASIEVDIPEIFGVF